MWDAGAARGHVGQPDQRIDIVELCRRNERGHGGCPLAVVPDHLQEITPRVRESRTDGCSKDRVSEPPGPAKPRTGILFAYRCGRWPAIPEHRS